MKFGLSFVFLQYFSAVASAFLTFSRTRIPFVCAAGEMAGNEVPTWEELNKMLRKKEPEAERLAFDEKKIGRGSANHKSNLRLFDAPADFNPRVTLYRDTAGWCPYCQKVWLTLEEKRIPYRVVKNPLSCYGEKTREFLRVSPSGQLPVAEINGRIVSESNLIMDVLETEFPTHKPLLPPEGKSERVLSLYRLERRVFSTWFSWLTSRGGVGFEAEIDRQLEEVDKELKKASGGPFFLGADLSLVDIMFVPFLERMAASLPYFKGFECRSKKYPHLLRWYEAIDSRESYQGIKSDYYTHCHDLPPQIGSCHFTPESSRFKEEIDGGCWDLTVDAESCLEPMVPLDFNEARRDAARQVIDNAENVVKFACRGAGSPGAPSVRAQFSDPHAKANLSLVPTVDLALRFCVSELLEPGATRCSVEPRGENDSVILCLEYLKKRVGVPRDMSVHGARQLRGVINFMISKSHK